MKTGIRALGAWALTGVIAWGAETVAGNSGSPTVLRPGPATVVADRLNVRGQPRLQSERVSQLQRGDRVWVFEEIKLEKPASGEPDRWARIALPAGIKVWIHSLYVDPTNKVVLPARLNLRAGPGEQYSVLGLLERGDSFVDTGVMEGDWIQIEAPTNAYGFVAARYLKQEAPAEPTVADETPTATVSSTGDQQASAPPGTPAPTPVTVAAAAQLAPPPEGHQGEEAARFTEPPPQSAAVDAAALERAREAMRRKLAELIAAEETARGTADLPMSEVRVVTREGVVRRARHIQAPTWYALEELETGRIINYLYTTATNLDLSRYVGRHVLVTGEEGLDPRWKATPVLTIRRIQVLP
ncbi:MAG: SH3 domain-containing protein [Verrucomicrobiota bacterium]|nr:SH3 domain-containing protein [Verrucomicrobiota bacterium]